MTNILKALKKTMDVEIIRGCNDVPLLSRWKILITPSFRLYLHNFHRSDEDRELHDHPWPFISFIISNGYVEVRPTAEARKAILARRNPGIVDESMQERKRYGAGSLLYRPAGWAHRIELVDGRPSWSLVLALKKTKSWGFFTDNGWIPWRQWTGAKICGDE
jgi:hypothetical protein